MKKVVLLISVVILVMSIFLVINIKKTNVREYNTLKINEFNIKERVTIKDNNEIYVGENVKEIENGYYDLKIASQKDNVQIFLNKLWYKKIDKDYIQDDYLANICREIVNEINISDNKDELEYMLYKYIKENYLNVRNNEKIEEIKLDKLTILLNLKDNIPILEIKGA